MAVEFKATFKEAEGLNATFEEPTALNSSMGEVMRVVTDDYNELQNKPSINGVTLEGDKSLSDLDAIDSTLTESGKAADAKAVGDALATKAEIDGYYDEMAVGSAEQLISTVLSEDTEPYTYRTTGGSADVGNRMNLKQVTGGTVAWNQLLSNTRLPTDSALYAPDSYTNNGVTFTKASDGGYIISTTAEGATGNQKVKIANAATLPVFGENTHVFYVTVGGLTSGVALDWSSTIYYDFPMVYKRYSASGFNLWLRVEQGTVITTPIEVYPVIIDLTQMFGSTIADYIYTLKQSTAGAGVAWFRKYFPDDYYAYNAGELVSVQTSGRETVGFNQWDEEWELGSLSTSTGLPVGNSNQIRSKNYIPIFPDTAYYGYIGKSGLFAWFYDEDKNFIAPNVNITKTEFTTPSNARYMRIATYNSSIQTTEYRGDICINLSHSGYRNGEYEPYQKHTYPLSPVTLRGIPKLSDGAMVYDGDSYTPDGTVTRRYGVRAYQAGDATDGSTMITDGINTVYELATPTTETADPYHEIQIVDDFGTERFLDAPIPVGTVSEYQANLRDRLQHLPDLADADGIYAIQQTGQQMTLVPVTTPTELPTAPTTDGAYVLRATVSNGVATYTWENAT